MDELLKQIKRILDTPNDKVDIPSAAVLLLKFSKNRILNENIIRRNNVEKLKHELRKYYNFHSAEALKKETWTLEAGAKKIVEETLPALEQKESEESKGLRADHDRLPEEIKALAIENRNNYPRMRKLHEQLKLLVNARPCDRYPFLQELKELDALVRKNWNNYDAYIAPPANSDSDDSEQTLTPPSGDKDEDDEKRTETAPPAAKNAQALPTVDAKQISAARKYLSDNKDKLATLKAQEDWTACNELRNKMQQRLSLLIQANAGISKDYLAELATLGLKRNHWHL
jgi:hypothetical protein